MKALDRININGKVNDILFNKNVNHAYEKNDIVKAFSNKQINNGTLNLKDKKKQVNEYLDEKSLYLCNLFSKESFPIETIYNRMSDKDKERLDDLTIFQDKDHACRELELLFKGIITFPGKDGDTMGANCLNNHSVNLSYKFLSRRNQDSQLTSLMSVYHQNPFLDSSVWGVRKQLTNTAKKTY